MKLISWNVNGLRAILKKDFLKTMTNLDADIFAIQETKMQVGQATINAPDYKQYFNSAVRKGYSGTAVLTKGMPMAVYNGFNLPELDQEGRLITLEYPDFYFVTCYVPNTQMALKRLSFRQEWDQALQNYLVKLDQRKPVIFCGDLNVAHHEIDLKSPQRHHHDPGFSDEERLDFTNLLNHGFTDTFRWLHPQTVEYSWWSYRFHARERNAGWRIDYFLVSNRLQDKIKEAAILTNITGSDHCPIVLDIDLSFKSRLK